MTTFLERTSMKENFDFALKFVISWEGTDFENDPRDPGGATRYGIIQSEYNKYRKLKGLSQQSVRYITKDEYIDIYHNNYWNYNNCDNLPSGIDLYIFNAGVNTGVRTGVKFIQRALGVSDDGVVGPNTLKAINEYTDKYSLIKKAWAEQLEYYKSLKIWKYYGAGWVNRGENLLQEARKIMS